jgi:hypothetical protein
MKKIIFYNHYQNGDVALTRGIVDWLVNNCKNDVEFYFLMFKNNNMKFNDRVKVIQSTHIQENWDYNAYKVNEGIYVGEDYITINLWIGASPAFMNRSDAPRNQWGNPIDYIAKWIYEQCKEIIDFLHSNTEIRIEYPNSEIDVIPKTCKNPPQKKEVDAFLESVKHFRKKILICNGPVESGQCPNFSVRELIFPLVSDKEDVCFIYTYDEGNYLNNEFCINQYCAIPNLNEIDYLSSKCDVLVSRNSGPGCVIQSYDNIFNSNIYYIFLTNWKEHTLVYEQGPCKILHTNDYSSQSIQNIIKNCIN